MFKAVAKRNARLIAPRLLLPRVCLARPSVRPFSAAVPRFQQQENKKDKDGWQKIGQIKQEKPRYQLTFTCKKCTTRSSHEVSKQAYHKGTVLIQCPGCKNRHLIADHLKIFSDKRITLEDILASKGESLERGTISEDQLEGSPQDMEWEEVPKALADKMHSD